MPAANMTQAAAQAGENVQLVMNTGGAALLKTRLDSWNVALRGNLNPDLATHRTVLNWIPRGQQIAAGIDTTLTAIQAQGVADLVTMFVYQSCEAVAEASISGRITVAQSAAILASYNVLWP
jgi:hypothetical protein